ncbi:hypothetical protein BDY19DRAFT_910263 [Irpex rosettiformis]|uniref:Uncharacterized protein n=1 Tax=Irpex rosettiformis TaxID=378272 RepID=A0ACB8TP91_9APHY|nr:hypothetical protein BDY19DRAFT_910263 [Irpex rosettiformis]
MSPVTEEPAKAPRKTETSKEVKETTPKKTSKSAAEKETKKTTAKEKAKPKKVKKVKKVAAKPKIDIKGHKPPKAAPSSWILFAKARKAELGTTFHSITEANQFMREASAVWKTLPEEEKQKFNDQAKVLMADYIIRRKEYLATTPPAIIKEINKRSVQKGGRAMKLPSRKPASAYLRFLAEYSPEFKKIWQGEPKDFVRNLAPASAERWRLLSDAEKAPYFEAWRKDTEKYFADKAAAADAAAAAL